MILQNIARKILRIYPLIRSKSFVIINRWIFILHGAKLGTNVRIFDRVYLRMMKGAKLTLGDNFVFSSGNGINPLCRNIRGEINITENGEIAIGNNTGISSACIWAKSKISIGERVNIGGDCIIMDTDAHNHDWQIRAGMIQSHEKTVSDYLTAKAAPIKICNDVFIGTRCIILKGVVIGARSIIAAGSVVTKSIPSDCIAAGNPCRVIKMLSFESNTLKAHD